MLVGLLVLIGGGVGGGVGMYQEATDTCASGYGVTITQLAANETADPTAEHIAYSNLSSTEQLLFREILAADTTPIYQHAPLDNLTHKVVTYQGQQYETSRRFIADCGNLGAVFKAWGSVFVFLGTSMIVAAAGWRYLR